MVNLSGSTVQKYARDAGIWRGGAQSKYKALLANLSRHPGTIREVSSTSWGSRPGKRLTEYLKDLVTQMGENPHDWLICSRRGRVYAAKLADSRGSSETT